MTKKLRYQYSLKQEQCHSLNYKTHNYLRRLDDQQIHHQVYLKILRYDFMDLFGYKQLYSKEKKIHTLYNVLLNLGTGYFPTLLHRNLLPKEIKKF